MTHGFAATRAGLTRAIDTGPLHLRPIVRAVRDHGCAEAIVMQSAGAFTLPLDRPTIAIVGDDTNEALGPSAFDPASLRSLFRVCSRIAIVASEPEVDVYQAVASVAGMLRLHVALVETRPRFEADWLACIREVSPKVPVLLSTGAAAGHA